MEPPQERIGPIAHKYREVFFVAHCGFSVIFLIGNNRMMATRIHSVNVVEISRKYHTLRPQPPVYETLGVRVIVR